MSPSLAATTRIFFSGPIRIGVIRIAPFQRVVAARVNGPPHALINSRYQPLVPQLGKSLSEWQIFCLAAKAALSARSIAAGPAPRAAAQSTRCSPTTASLR